MQVLQDWAETALLIMAHMAPLWFILWVVERVFPHGRVSIRSQLRSVGFWALYALATAAVLVVVKALKEAAGLSPVLIVPLRDWFAHPWISWLAFIACPMIGFVIYDFFQYWMHRAQHRFFWRQHVIHHSIGELSAVNSYFHWTEELFRACFITLPFAVLIGVDSVPVIAAITLLNNLHGFYLHSPTRFHFGPALRRVIADNRFHRIHHSRESRHHDRNFGAFTSLWDQLFGTAYFPEKDEWPDTGVDDHPEPEGVADYLWRPFRRPGSAPEEPAGALPG